MKSLLTGFLGLIAAVAPAIAQVEAVAQDEIGAKTEKTTGVDQMKRPSTVWLIMKEGLYTYGELGIALEKLQMRDMEQCEEQGAIFLASERLGRTRNRNNLTGFECIEGK